MISISSLYSKFRKSKELETALSQTPQTGGGMLMFDCGYEHMAQTAMINIATSFLPWWKTKNRTVWRITPETSEYLKTVNLSFLPETPPKTWNGDAIILESKSFDKPFIHDVFSLVCYKIPDLQGVDRYFFTALSYPDGALVFSITTDLFKINKKLAASGDMFTPGFVNDQQVDLQGSVPPEKREMAFDIIKFVFAFSFYLDSPDRIIVNKEPGPPARNEKKKPIRKKGEVVSLWTYSNAELIINRHIEFDTEQPLDKTDLSLKPVIVSPHIRRQGDKIIIIDSYDSHRWKNPEKIAAKKTI